MPFSIDRVGQVVAKRADRLAIDRFFSINDLPEVITLVWNGSHVKHTLWTLMPNGSIFETELNSHSGGPELALASYSPSRVVSMNRSGPAGALKFEAWETGGIFELSDDALAPADRAPEMVAMGGVPPDMILSSPPPQVATAAKSAKLRGSAGTSPHKNAPPQPPGGSKKKVVVVDNINIGMGPKAGHAVVAAITQGFDLRVSLWAFDDGGDFKMNAVQMAEGNGGSAVSHTSIVKIKEEWADTVRGPMVKTAEVVTASVVSNGPHQLKVQRWRVSRPWGAPPNHTPAAVELLSEHIAPEIVQRVAAAPVTAFSGTQVATVVQLVGGSLKIIGWKMESNGTITRWTDTTATGLVSGVSAARVRGRNIVTALREADGRFKISYWRFPTTLSGAIEHRGDAVEGPIGSSVRCTHIPGVGSQLGNTVAATQTDEGKLQLFRYKVTE